MLSPPALLAYNIVLGTTFTIGFVGNLLVLLVICSLKAAHSVTNVYLMNLAVADCLHLLSIPPFIHLTNVRTWLWGTYGCKIFYLLHYANWNVSVYIITAMSFDRYKAVVSPFSSARYRTKRFAMAVLVCLWVVSAALVSPIYLSAYVEEWPPANDENGTSPVVYTCMHIAPGSLNHSEPAGLLRKLVSDPYYFSRYIFVTGCVAPGLLLSGFYALILRKLYLLKRSRSAGAQAQQRFEKVTVLVIAVVAFYLVCCMPHWIFTNVAVEFSQPGEWVSIGAHVTTLLGYLNSAGNPVLYAFLNDPFRASLRAMLARHLGIGAGMTGVGHGDGGGGGGGGGCRRDHGGAGTLTATVRSTSLRTPEVARSNRDCDCDGAGGDGGGGGSWEPIPLLDRKMADGAEGTPTVNFTTENVCTALIVTETAID